jgi:hypothetical protein
MSVKIRSFQSSLAAAPPPGARPESDDRHGFVTRDGPDDASGDPA